VEYVTANVNWHGHSWEKALEESKRLVVAFILYRVFVLGRREEGQVRGWVVCCMRVWDSVYVLIAPQDPTYLTLISESPELRFFCSSQFDSHKFLSTCSLE
jgi:hypothetical protein